jgi:hypothetical protein
MEVIGQRHTPSSLLPGKEPPYPFDRRLGGPQSRSGRSGEEKNSQPLPVLEPPIIQHVAQLSWLPEHYVMWTNTDEFSLCTSDTSMLNSTGQLCNPRTTCPEHGCLAKESNLSITKWNPIEDTPSRPQKFSRLHNRNHDYRFQGGSQAPGQHRNIDHTHIECVSESFRTELIMK